MRRAIALTFLAAAGAVMLAAPAHADPQSEYLDYLAGQGFQVNPITTPQYMFFGNMACEDLRNGGTQQANAHLGSFPGANPALVQMVVKAAQAELCPDTQGR